MWYFYNITILCIGKNALRLHAFVSDRHSYFMRVVKADIRNPLRYLQEALMTLNQLHEGS